MLVAGRVVSYKREEREGSSKSVFRVFVCEAAKQRRKEEAGRNEFRIVFPAVVEKNAQSLNGNDDRLNFPPGHSEILLTWRDEVRGNGSLNRFYSQTLHR